MQCRRRFRPLLARASSACASSRWRLQPVKRLAEAPFATIPTSPVLRTWGPDNSAVRRTIHIQNDVNHALLYAATMARDGGSNGTKRTKAPQSAVARWASGGDSPCAAQTRPSPTNPERPPSSGHIDASTESWRATLHQGVACAQGQDVVVAHHRAAGVFLLINSLRRVERESWQLLGFLRGCRKRARARGPRRDDDPAAARAPRGVRDAHVCMLAAGAVRRTQRYTTRTDSTA